VLGALLKKVSSFVVMIVSLILILAGSIVLSQTHSYPVAFGSLVVIGMGLAAGFPVILGYIGQMYPHLSGTAFSIALVIALTGNTLINYFFGFIAAEYNVSHLPSLVIVCTICMLVILLFIKQKIAGKIKL
jgi:MFS family permease